MQDAEAPTISCRGERVGSIESFLPLPRTARRGRALFPRGLPTHGTSSVEHYRAADPPGLIGVSFARGDAATGSPETTLMWISRGHQRPGYGPGLAPGGASRPVRRCARVSDLFARRVKDNAMPTVSEIRRLGTLFDPFLHATVGNDRNNNPVTMLSTLARLGLEPWDAASDLAALPQEVARERLDGMLAEFAMCPRSGTITL
jgi:hypothetical protein